jgi:plastocyanin
MRVIRALSPVVCVLALAGTAACSTTGAGAGTSAAGVGATGTVRRLAVTITGSTVTPAPAQVDVPVGSTLELVVTSDHDDELHAHGFDQEVQLRAGTPATLRLTAKDPGLYEVETHEPALTLLTVAVR